MSRVIALYLLFAPVISLRLAPSHSQDTSEPFEWEPEMNLQHELQSHCSNWKQELVDKTCKNVDVSVKCEKLATKMYTSCKERSHPLPDKYCDNVWATQLKKMPVKVQTELFESCKRMAPNRHEIISRINVLKRDPDMMKSEKSMRKQALKESGLDPGTISKFGRNIVKFPESFVKELLALRNTTKKTHTYTFIGRLVGRPGFAKKGNAETLKREWTLDFAKSHFGDNDVFVRTIPGFEKPAHFNDNIGSLGKFDKTDMLADRSKHDVKNGVDRSYWKTMMESEFTLCPGGDTSWSMRAYEAALAGSICVISSEKEDWRPSTSKHPGDRHLQAVFDLFKHVNKDQPHQFSQSIADENLRTFIRYLTFMEGDNVPPNLKADNTFMEGDNISKDDDKGDNVLKEEKKESEFDLIKWFSSLR